VDVRLEVASVGALEQDLRSFRPRRLDVPPREIAARHGVRVVPEEAVPHIPERRLRMLREVRVHRLARSVRELEVVATGLRPELPLALVEEGRPARFVEAVGGVQGKVDPEPVFLRSLPEPVSELAPLAMPE